MMKTLLLWLIAVSVSGAGGLAPATEEARAQPPAAAGSGMYSLAAADGTTVLSWIEPAGAGVSALKFSTLQGERWSPARTVAQGNNWFVNWADHPSVVPLPDGSLVAHWLVNNSIRQGSYGYGIRIARSTDHGDTWTEVFKSGTANVDGYSGFVSLHPLDRGFMAVYLGPPSTMPSHGGSGDEHVMGLSAATFDADGHLLTDVVIDADTCTCCPTAVARTPDGPLVAYRDHTGGTRDISVTRLRGGRWTPPEGLHPDGWRINACPTNGPSLSSSGGHVAAAWFTAAGDSPRLKVSLSRDGGQHFEAPLTVDGGRPVGWPGVVSLEDGSVVVSWVESLGDGRGELRLRRAGPAGHLGPVVTVASVGAGRATGMPQLVRKGDRLVVAWRSDRVLTAFVPIPPAGTSLPAGR